MFQFRGIVLILCFLAIYHQHSAYLCITHQYECKFNFCFVLFYQLIPQDFLHEYQQLVSECSSYRSVGAFAPIDLTHRLETVLVIVEEGMQLLLGSFDATEYSLLSRMRRDLMQHLCLLLYGMNDCTIPPVALCLQEYTGLRGRPKIVINIDSVELLRSCGYTWNEVASALQVARSTLWRRLKDAGVEVNKYTDISDDELDSTLNPLISGHLKYGHVH